MLETIEDVSTITNVVIRVFLVVNFLNEHRWVEVDERARHTLRTVLSQVDRSERSIWTVALADHRHAAPTTTVWIEPISLLTRHTVNSFHQVRSKHRVPLTTDEPLENGTLVAPLRQVLNGCRPHTDVGTAVGSVSHIVRTNDVSAELTRLVRVLKHTRFAVRQMFPKRQIRILCRHRQRGSEGAES